jgi:hypothetical protein
MRPNLLIAILLLGAGAVARADTLTFTNAAGSGLWSDPLNWDALRVPTGADDVVVPASPASCRITTPSACNGISAGALVVFEAPTQINGPSTFSAGVQLNSTITGNGDLTFASSVDWRSGSLEGAGLALVPEGVTIRVVPEGQPTLSRVLEVFGTIEVDDQVFRITRPEGLLRIPDTGVLRLMNGGSVLASQIDGEAFVISGALECAGTATCAVDALFLSTARVSAACPLVITPPPGNLSPEGVLSGGLWETSGEGSIEWSEQSPVLVLDAGTTLRMNGTGSSPTLYGNLRRIDGELLVDAKDPAVVVRAGASNPTVITGRVRVAGDSRISFSTGFVCEPTAILELAPSFVQPPITALNSVGPAATLDGALEVLLPTTAPEGCGEYIALITGAGSFDAMTGDFDVVSVPPISLDQPFAYTVERFLGSVIESVVVYSNSLADWNLDGGVDSDDVITYFEDWDRSEADVTGDGGTDGDDIIYFFSRWDQGC